MKADAILRVTEALRDRLKVALASSGVPGTVFVGPLDDPDASGAALILLLYRVVPSPSLRNREHRVVSTATPPAAVVFQGSLPLDLYFLVTVGTTPGSSDVCASRKGSRTWIRRRSSSRAPAAASRTRPRAR